MMRIREIMKQLQLHPVVGSQISMQMQLGLPFLELRNGRLCMSFAPHREELRDGQLCFYERQYEIMFVYPFQQVISFQNLSRMGCVNTQEPVCRIAAEAYLSRARQVMNELLDACDTVLAAQERYHKVSEIMIEDYQKNYDHAVSVLGLESLYKRKGNNNLQ